MEECICCNWGATAFAMASADNGQTLKNGFLVINFNTSQCAADWLITYWAAFHAIKPCKFGVTVSNRIYECLMHAYGYTGDRKYRAQ